MPPDPDPAALERQREVKVLLKRWEAEFLREQRRKPTQADIEAAPEETRRLYREYKRLKEAGKAPDPSGKSQEMPPVEQDSGFWGSHLNRKPKIPEKSRNGGAGMSAQECGRRLRAKLGGTGKETPLTPRRIPNPRRIPVSPRFRTHPEPPPSEEEPGKPGDPKDSGDSKDSGELLLPPSLSGLTPLILTSGMRPPNPPHPEKFQRLRQSLARTLGSLDPAWLQRCQESPGKEGIPAGATWEWAEGDTGGHSRGDSRGKEPCGNAGKDLEAPKKLQRGQEWDNNGKIGMKRSREEEEAPENFLEEQEVAKEKHMEDPKESGKMLECLENILEEEKKEKHLEAPKKTRKMPKLLENIVEEEEEKEKHLEAPKKRRKTPKGLENFLEEEEEEKEKHLEAPKKRRKTPKGLENFLEEEKEKLLEAPKRRRKTPKRLENFLEEEEGDQEKLLEAPKKRRKTSKVLENIPEEEEKEKLLEAPRKRRRTPKALENTLEEEGEPKPAPHTRKVLGNFVRLNLKRKTFVRGNVLRGRALRKQVWREKWRKKWRRLGGSGSDLCFRCGNAGHWASECPGRGLGSFPEEKGPGKEEEEKEDPLPTLEEVARRTNSVIHGIPGMDSTEPGSSWTIPEAPHSRHSQLLEFDPCPPPAPVEPLYTPGPDGAVPDPPEEVLAALRELGHGTFRPGQATAVMRILCGLSTLVVLPTGSGKSLCYQLPALLFHRNSRSVTIVVSPLVALMDDQVSGLRRCLRAECVHSGMSPARREAALEKVLRGQVQVLLVSPEFLVSSGSAFPAFPPVAFACLDEVHCLARWAHNFRPSYLRICQVLRDRFGVRCFLGLTATATAATAREVSQHLGIPPDPGSTVRAVGIPDNLRLTVALERDRDEALLSLLRREPFRSMGSIIVYCTRRDDTERVARLIRTTFQGIPGGKGQGTAGIPAPFPACAYHAGLAPPERRRVQRDFGNGLLRVVVATVAFGLGLDKGDVGGIVHHGIPRDVESFVQEVGRAGRDGNAAHCHLLLEPQGRNLPELRRHIYGNSMEFWAIKKLVLEVFAPCKCQEIHRRLQEIHGKLQESPGKPQEIHGKLQDSPGNLQEIHGKIQDNPGNLQEIPGKLQDIHEKLQESPGKLQEIPGKLQDIHEKLQESPGKLQDLVQDWEFWEEEAKEKLENLGMEPQERICRGHERALDIQNSMESLDASREGIETLLALLAMPPRPWLQLLPPLLSRARVRCQRGAPMGSLAQSCPALAAFLARERLAGRELRNSRVLEFDVVELSDLMGWEVELVKRDLRRLQREGVQVEFEGLSFHFRSFGDLSGPELDQLCSFLHRHVRARERAALQGLHRGFRLLHSVAFQGWDPEPPEEEKELRSSRLKELLREYLEREEPGGDEEEEEEEEQEEELGCVPLRDWQSCVRSDIRHLLSIRPDEPFSGRAIARIFHGISSPRFPAEIYGRDRRFWRKHLQLDFHGLCRLATEEILLARR